MKNLTSLPLRKLFVVVIATMGIVNAVLGQTSSFTYQGRFTDNGTPANGTYEMQFRLFDGLSSSNQIGSTITNSAVNVSEGVFTVQLDYGAPAFSGANRYLEIGVRAAGGSSSFTILSPRQQLTSAVYAIRAGSATNADNATSAANSTQLGGVNASQYVQTTDARLTDARTPTAGSSNYIQNSTNQQSASFNINGSGTVGGNLSGNSINSATNFKINNNIVFSVSGSADLPLTNTFAGFGAGALTTPGPTGGAGNSFFGREAGGANTTGLANSFFGTFSGITNTTGNSNSFVGAQAGQLNKTGSQNSFFGAATGGHNIDGNNNSFFGYLTGSENTSGNDNSFFGSSAGAFNTTGIRNSFFGYFAGHSNKTGDSNTAIGRNADMFADNLTNATAIGAWSYVSQSNSLVLGSIAGFNGATADTNVGIGTHAPKSKLHIAFGANNLHLGHAGCSSGLGIGFGATMTGCNNFALLGSGLNTVVNRPTGGSIFFAENNITQMTLSSGGALSILTLGSAGSTALCRNASNQISTCSSSLRYKTNIQAFVSGLSVLNRLRPITFDWKDGGMHDLGFGAEDIAAVEPLLVTRNDKGEVEGVKYDRITAVLVNAVKEQQQQIQQQQAQLKLQQQQIDSLRRLVTKRSRTRRK